jgi:hypothetical protein
MATVPPKPSGKGVPPQQVNIADNLDKPERGELVALNFKVPWAFRKEFKVFAVRNGKTMNQILREAFALYKERSHPRTLMKGP